MKNFIFISPNFPLTYWRFCKELKNNGLRVLLDRRHKRRGDLGSAHHRG